MDRARAARAGGETSGEIVPLVLRYPNGEPCIPIRLTAIATVPDMPITAYFLTDGDVHPSNYLETEVPDGLGFWRSPNTYWLPFDDKGMTSNTLANEDRYLPPRRALS